MNVGSQTETPSSDERIVFEPEICYTGAESIREGAFQMQKKHQFTAVIEREDDMYVALCPELDIAS